MLTLSQIFAISRRRLARGEGNGFPRDRLAASNYINRRLDEHCVARERAKRGYFFERPDGRDIVEVKGVVGCLPGSRPDAFPEYVPIDVESGKPYELIK